MDTVKSRILLDGIYSPNIENRPEDSSINVTDFIKEKGNYKKEHVRICDIYDQSKILEHKAKYKLLKKEAKVRELTKEELE